MMPGGMQAFGGGQLVNPMPVQFNPGVQMQAGQNPSGQPDGAAANPQ